MTAPRPTGNGLDMTFKEAVRRFSQVNTRDVQPDLSTEPGANPFVKWVGGKRNIIQELTTRLPKAFNGYYEPMVGGGALFFAIHDRLTTAHLSDANWDLVMAYKVIQRDREKLVAILKKHGRFHNETYYYKVRDQHHLKDPIEIAARFIYLNKTCYNGLYRVNRQGEFNVPMGRYQNPNIVQEENLLAVERALQKAKISYRSFETITPTKGDFVYFDPPYHPTTEDSFTTYTAFDFSEKDQQTLRDFFKKLDGEGVRVMLSNSNTRFIRTLYQHYEIAVVHAPRYINCKPGMRGNVEEVVITNY